MDYAYLEKRKSKNDKRAKSRFNRYKKGGSFRSTNVKLSSNTDNKQQHIF